ncbi:hypothetical protein HOU02_gp342 [Caulobacter phage CcrBL9]|uniref:Uncharacterized protein n=1 Tax=Caulobacter phage CcrBL9 TaxID=2283270 RepID=A0A385EC81_9CAUD|nr:hypothetical protein HOU02_gp342 [Caulobacter phage CcrBL9]AXQ69383.1 hypothetical protein CcrBL9_gp359 [Caulobacter phage CcrBL9]
MRYHVDSAGSHLHFEIHDADGSDDAPLIDGAARIFGTVNWEGCINWRTHKYMNCHFCTPADSLRLHELFKGLWRLASLSLPNWCGDVEETA